MDGYREAARFIELKTAASQEKITLALTPGEYQMPVGRRSSVCLPFSADVACGQAGMSMGASGGGLKQPTAAIRDRQLLEVKIA